MLFIFTLFQIYFPSHVNVYGSALKIVELGGSCYAVGHYIQNINIERTHVKALDKPSQHCDSETPKPNTSTCIADYITNKIGCKFRMEGNQYYNGSLCRTKAQLLELQNLTRIFQEADENDIYEMTGCLASCLKYEFSITTDPISKSQNYGNCDFDLKVFIKDRSYKEEEQYIIYDEWSFLADVGGYMGLLLGYSLLSLFTETEDLFRKLLKGLTKIWKQKKGKERSYGNHIK